MVGNDIVDLNFVGAPAYHHLGYLERVCTPEEARAVRDSADPSRSLAVAWASKEAAYKLFSKQLARRCFVPRQFVARAENGTSLDSTSGVRITYEGIEAVVAICSTGQWVHAIATLFEDQIVRWAVKNIERGSAPGARAKYESQAVRFLAKQLLQRCGLEDAELEFAGRVPTVRRKEQLCGEIGISLSHHGAFAGAVIAWPSNESLRPQRMDHKISEISSREAVCSTCMV